MSNKEYIFVKENRMLVKIAHKDISHIRSDRDYCKIYASKKIFHIHITIDKFASYLPKDMFYRCHRSFIVNVDRITAISGNDIFIDGNYVQIAQPNRAELLKRINYVHSTYEDGKRVK